MTGSNPPHGGPDQPGPGNQPNETVHWWSTPATADQPLAGTDPTVMGGQPGPGPVTGTDPTVLGSGFDAYHSSGQLPYAPQPPSHPGYPQQPHQFPPQYAPQPGYPQPPGKNNTPWIVGGVVGLIVVIGIVILVVALTGNSGGGGGGTTKKNGVDGNYAMDKVTNACSLVDITVLSKWAPTPKDPEHTERAGDSSYGGGNLSCRASYGGAGKYGMNGSDLDFEADFKSKYGDPQFNSWKNSDTKTTGSGRTSGDIAGIGTQAYYAAYQQDYSSFVTLDYTCAAIDSNVSAKVELRVQAEGSINTDDVGTTCKNQLKKALAGMHK